MKNLDYYKKKLLEKDTHKMEAIWLSLESFNMKERSYDIYDKFTDEEYIIYHIWKSQNEHWLRDKHHFKKKSFDTAPKYLDSKKIIFHGGCQRCISIEIFGIERCMECKFFRNTLNNEKDLGVRQPL